MPPKKRKTSDADKGEENRLEKLMSAQGKLQESTRKRRTAVLDDFKNNVTDAGINFDVLMEQQNTEEGKQQLEKAMVSFLDNYKVLDKETNKPIRPKANTLDFIRSNLKSALSEITGHNFSDKIAFPGLNNATKALHKEIKEAGR